ncbi:hypothetical protein [Krasilnikovia cinnamomea]|uniref:hypothetical protein n=1 Tax=Krasilnikovia cinnamomea TaxID=349313 RepID=UPI00102BDBB4|nr:hypothetical protein [Krasilnikovia cinnamomea]
MSAAIYLSRSVIAATQLRADDHQSASAGRCACDAVEPCPQAADAARQLAAYARLADQDGAQTGAYTVRCADLPLLTAATRHFLAAGTAACPPLEGRR